MAEATPTDGDCGVYAAAKRINEELFENKYDLSDMPTVRRRLCNEAEEWIKQQTEEKQSSIFFQLMETAITNNAEMDFPALTKQNLPEIMSHFSSSPVYVDHMLLHCMCRANNCRAIFWTFNQDDIPERSYRADQQPDQTSLLKNNCKIHLLHAPTKSVWTPESTTVTWQQQNIAKIANHWLILRPTEDP